MLEMLKWTTDQLMKIEVEQKMGAEKGKHTNDRKTSLSGTRPRRFDTRMGTMYLMVPKLRKGGYIPFFVTERNRSEQALIALVKEAYVNGVSTRKIDRLTKSMGIENISAGQVSIISKGLDEQVEEFRNRPLASKYPFVWVDAVYEKIRVNNRVVSMAILIAIGVNEAGTREILAIEPMFNESEDTWTEFFRGLKERGLTDICLCISDAHIGIQKGLKKVFIGSAWQRCKVHFMRNVLAKMPHHEKAKFAEKLKQIWIQPNKEEALKVASRLIDDYEKKLPDAIKCLEDGIEDSLQFFDYPEIDKRKISSTNIIERLNREIRRRSRVVGIFPSKDSFIRLLTSYLIEYSDDWAAERCYIKSENILKVFERKVALLEAA